VVSSSLLLRARAGGTWREKRWHDVPAGFGGNTRCVFDSSSGRSKTPKWRTNHDDGLASGKQPRGASDALLTECTQLFRQPYSGARGKTSAGASILMNNAPFFRSLSVRPLPKRLQKTSRQGRLSRRQAWLHEVDSGHLFHRLFDLIPGVSFFAKNRAGELMFASRTVREKYHIRDEADIIGLTDFDLSSPDMARAYVADDRKILESGEPILNRIELGFDESGVPDWFVVNKLPIRSRDGAIIGVMGLSHSYKGREGLLPHHDIAKAVDYVRDHYQDPFRITELARLVGLSVRQLQRKFKLAFGTSPHEFVLKTRLLAACRALRETDLNAGEIAANCGFNDQSSFTKHFREHVGLTPRRYRFQVRSTLST
jgi:AraC-like DNA-binding protein